MVEARMDPATDLALIDVDYTLLNHVQDLNDPDWPKFTQTFKGRVVIITSRHETERGVIVDLLDRFKIRYDLLIMTCGLLKTEWYMSEIRQSSSKVALIIDDDTAHLCWGSRMLMTITDQTSITLLRWCRP